MLGEIPVGMASRGNIPGHASLFALVQRELDAGKIQQAGLAAALGADQQVPGQLTAPALAASAVETGAAQGADGVAIAVVQLVLLFDDDAFTAQAFLCLFVILFGFLLLAVAPMDESHAQAPDEEDEADKQQAVGDRGEDLAVIDGQQRAAEPDQHSQCQYDAQAQGPALAKQCESAIQNRSDIHWPSSLDDNELSTGAWLIQGCSTLARCSLRTQLNPPYITARQIAVDNATNQPGMIRINWPPLCCKPSQWGEMSRGMSPRSWRIW